MLAISRADFDDPALADFLQQHLDDMATVSPADSCHALDLAELKRPAVRVWAAYDDGSLVGTAALAGLEPGHEELKSMRTAPLRRGAGVATQLLQHVLGDARARNVTRISLETGSMEFFVPARALYAKHGFVVCRPFGGYVEDPHSTFMTLSL